LKSVGEESPQGGGGAAGGGGYCKESLGKAEGDGEEGGWDGEEGAEDAEGVGGATDDDGEAIESGGG
jgi:hypothetical protein